MPQASALRSRANVRREIARLREEGARSRRDDAVKKPRGWPHWALIVTSIVSLLVALLSGGFTLYESQVGAREERQKESREKRSQLYADYLATAHETATANRNVASAHNRLQAVLGNLNGAQPAPGSASNSLIAARAAELQAAKRSSDRAAAAFAKQADLLYVYGSDGAWLLHQPIAETFETFVQTTKVSLGGRGQSKEELSWPPEQQRRYEEAVRAFRSMFCREASATPRRGCSQPR